MKVLTIKRSQHEKAHEIKFLTALKKLMLVISVVTLCELVDRLQVFHTSIISLSLQC